MSKSAKTKIKDAVDLLIALEITPTKDTNRRWERLGLALLGCANLKPVSKWTDAANESESKHKITTRQMIEFWNKHYGQKLSRGSYDDVKRQELDVLIVAGVVSESAGNPDANYNDPTRGYAISKTAGEILKSFGRPDWEEKLGEFKKVAGSLKVRINKNREKIFVQIKTPDGTSLELDQGPHNQLQKEVVESFLPQFVPDALLLYVGDAKNKSLFLDEDYLRKLGMNDLAHARLPDVVAYSPARAWIILIEAVHSANPVDHIRHLQMEKSMGTCKVPRVYVSAFANRASFRKWVCDISWETEVWLSDEPTHLIHFNGDKFLGPYTGG